MSEDPLIAIFKLGQKAHMEELLNKGHVFMNTIAYFSSLEEASPRSDPDEGTRYRQNADGAILQMQNEGQWQTVGGMAGAMRFHDKDLESANLYCLHTRRRREYGIVFELNELEFGDSYVLFLDANEFFRRLDRAAAREGHTLQRGMVNYVDRRTYTGPMGVFRKFLERVADKELRVAILPGTDAPLSLKLGDLSDIAIMGATKERVRLDPNLPSGKR